MSLMRNRLFLISCFCLSILVSPAQASDLELLRVDVNASAIQPGKDLEITYSLRSSGSINSAFNMGIFIAKGGNGKWVRRWGLPTTLLDQLKEGKTISQKYHVTVPEWGKGTYRISVQADVDNHLHETNRGNNLIEKKLSTFHIATLTQKPQLSLIRPIKLLGGKTRLVKPDGTITLHFANGSSRVLSPDGMVTPVNPEGAKMTPYSLQVSLDDLPPTPGNEPGWMTNVEERLIEIIQNHLQPDEFEHYLPLESGIKDYDLVLWRINFIEFLLSDNEEPK